MYFAITDKPMDYSSYNRLENDGELLFYFFLILLPPLALGQYRSQYLPPFLFQCFLYAIYFSVILPFQWYQTCIVLLTNHTLCTTHNHNTLNNLVCQS